ncbi:MAG: BRCT domain-containing protein, partial [Alphaproteobacteria bacterium]|nr:BRCT domain-containing protein [Alphaproteobacteria bacterium]
IVTNAERRDLQAAARALSIDEEALDQMLEIARTVISDEGNVIRLNELDEMFGMSVCLTGTSRCSIADKLLTRAKALEFAKEAGLDVQKSITKSLDLLVLADPHSMSGKAKKAREYGIRTMSEEVFWRKIGVDID